MAMQPGPGFAQESRGDSLSYIESYPWMVKKMVQRPFEWKAQEWVSIGATGLFVGTFLVFDEPINATISRWNTPFARSFGNVGDIAGGPYVQFGLSGASLLFGSLIDHEPLIHFGQDHLQAQLITGGATLAFKHLTHRERPLTNSGAAQWHGPFKGWEHRSFSSGHTALAFSTATMVFMHSGKKWWVGVGGYGTATAIAISRMQKQEHWSSDVAMGAILGTTISLFVYKMQEARRERWQKPPLKPLP